MHAYYTAELETARQHLILYRKKANRFSLLRLLVFGLAGILLYYSLDHESFAGTVGTFFAGILAFMYLVFKQAKLEEQAGYYEHRTAVLANELAVLEGEMNGYDNGQKFADDRHAYTSDLDIFGAGSLFHLLNRCVTPDGRSCLAGWLLSAADKVTIGQRQETAAEISTKPELKIHWQTLLWFAGKGRAPDPKQFFKSLKATETVRLAGVLELYSAVAGWLFLAFAAAAFFIPVFWQVLTAFATGNFLLANITARYVRKSVELAENLGKTLSAYAAVFTVIENESWTSPLAKETAALLVGGGKTVSGRIRSLAKITAKMNYMSNILVGGMLNISAVWGLKQFFALEAWKQENQFSFDGAFGAVARMEALMSLGTLRMNNPGWQQPLIDDSGKYRLKTAGLAHPLIPPDKRVANDFSLEGNHIDIITGSNMAGKSTFLRTVGINMVLAFSGAVVCAGTFEVSLVYLFSYMRIRDSLSESTSTFKAEIDRLKMLLEVCDAEPRVYFLIDEMLRGTNSVDKYAGSKAVLEKLIVKKAVGMFATHDLEIARMEEEHPEYIRNFYFDIAMRNNEMLFDYTLKTGACKTFNAAILLREIGIDVADSLPDYRNRT